METMISFENFVCPDCGDAFEEDDVMDLCHEPFNGTIIICIKCKTEFSADLFVRLVKLNGPEEPDED